LRQLKVLIKEQQRESPAAASPKGDTAAPMNAPAAKGSETTAGAGSKEAAPQHAQNEIRARDVVVATNPPVNLRIAIHTKQAPYCTYALATKIPAGAMPDALYWDTLDPYHYVRLQPLSREEDIVIVGGEDHKSREADDGAARFAALERWTRERLPSLRVWSGQVLEPTDFTGFIGRSPGEQARPATA
jgi:glycine/D-amino acid oxidase-like deaminating enzyme